MTTFRLLLLLSIFLLGNTATAQNFYPEKFEGCDTQQFALESDSVYAKKDKEQLIQLLTGSMDEKALSKTFGVLRVQIIAYEDGSSCLISYENNTTLDEETLNMAKIKETIDSELVWDEVLKACSPLMELKFRRKKISLKRIGFNGKKGMHELRD